jgi:hypothetical protein
MMKKSFCVAVVVMAMLMLGIASGIRAQNNGIWTRKWSAYRDLCDRRSVDARAVRRSGGTEIGGILRCDGQSDTQS